MSRLDPGSTRPYSPLQEAALIGLRLVVAAVFLYAGAAKWPLWSAPMEGMSPLMHNLIRFLSIVEPLGAVALLLGFLTRWAAAGLAIIMVGAVFFSRITMKTPVFTGPTGAGLDYNFLLLAGCIALVAFGAGRWSVDAMRRKAVAGRIAAALLAIVALGCAPARPAAATLPMPLVAALMNDNFGSGNRPAREFTVGAPPPGLPPALIPPAPVTVVGGVRMGDQVVAVFADSTRRVAAVLEEHFERNGFARPQRVPGAGFSSGYGPSNQLCTDSSTVHVEPLTGDERHLARVTYRRTRGASGCPPSRANFPPPTEPPTVLLVLPELTAPPGVRVRGTGGGSGGGDVNSRAEVTGDSLRAEALLAHYTAQLARAGWTALQPAIGDRVAAQYLEAKDAAGGVWRGALVAEGGGTTVRLALRMQRETSR